MMDPALKIAMVFCVLLMGICASLLFRHDRPRPTPPGPSVEEQLLLRYRLAAPAPALRQRGAGRSAPGSRSLPKESASSQPATVVTPLDRHEPPPPLAQDYPKADHPANSRWGVSMDMMLPMATPADETPHTHKVVDGDTLAALAERYLGSAARASEIYEANRDVLHDPDLLPIGVELKLQPRQSRPASTATPSSGASPLQGRLVPVR